MHHSSTYDKTTKERAKEFQAMACKDQWGAKVSQLQFDEADKMEVWSSSFNDAGEDFNEFRLFRNGERTTTRRVSGY